MGMIFNRTITRAIHLDLTEDYGTDGFATILGYPGDIHSDQASQLIAAAKDIAELGNQFSSGLLAVK